MSDKYWFWCPEADGEVRTYDLDPFGFIGTAIVTYERYFAVVTFKLSDVPKYLRYDVSYRAFLKYAKDSGANVPEEIAPRIFPVEAEVMDEAIDMVFDGIDQINKFFFSVMKMNEYQDDIRYMMDVGIGLLDYFIDGVSRYHDDFGPRADECLAQLRFKRSYMLSLKLHVC